METSGNRGLCGSDSMLASSCGGNELFSSGLAGMVPSCKSSERTLTYSGLNKESFFSVDLKLVFRLDRKTNQERGISYPSLRAIFR